jgi:hypothetical protein
MKFLWNLLLAQILSNDSVFSIINRKVIYFGSPMKTQHCFYMSLKLINLEDCKIEELVQIDIENKSL